MSVTIEERLADEADLSLDQLSHWSGVPYARVRQWADGDVEITDEETVRLKAVITLYLALYERLTWLGEVLEEKYGKPSKNGSRA
jgi:plasmid maintenance system antidote protein VapI